MGVVVLLPSVRELALLDEDRRPREMAIAACVVGVEVAVGDELAIVAIITPGPDTALLIRNTLAGGRSAGIATAVGVALGQATWSLATSVGVSALLVAAEPAFAALKLAGAAYLIYLGGQSLWSAYRGRSAHPAAHSGLPAVRDS